MIIFNRLFDVLVSPRRVPLRVFLITGLASFVLLMGGLLQGQPLYITALFTLLPWLPVLFFEGIWKVEHYSWIAIFGIIMLLQIGHLGEHVTQVAQLGWMNGTLACPPVVDSAVNAQRAVDAGLRGPEQGPSGISATSVVKPNPQTGLPAVDEQGNPIVGPAACGVFGQLDLEIVHLVWEVLGWLATLFLLVKFPRNIWLWIALIVVSIHSVEHLFISYVNFFEKDTLYAGAKQLWATTVEGKTAVAHPVGLEPVLQTFYGAGGKNGILGRGGMIDALLNLPASFLPTRPFLHFWYNFFVFVPTMVAFLVQVRQIYDEYLAKALPTLTEDQLVWVTPKLQLERYSAGSTIIAQGDNADHFYVISKGQVEVVLEHTGSGQAKIINRLNAGQYFGEMGLMQDTRRTATVRALTPVEVLYLNRDDFAQLINNSDNSRDALENLIGQRAQELLAIRQKTSPLAG
jgi:hypothetical protein